MLSFDITDRNIRVIKAKETGERIKIYSSVNIELEDGLVTNGYIKNITQVATKINEGLKSKNIKEKEAVVSISSNLIMFKELHIPNAKPAQFKTMVQNQMQNALNASDEHSISYTIAGNVEQGGKSEAKVLANACPKDVVDGYRRVFSMLSISLKFVSVSCNCISRLVLSDPKVSSKMPMLLVQIDPHFININVFENNQLSFSRFASISPDDYDDKSDYVYQAVNENIYRMLQFQRSRSSGNIKNVVFYGDTSEFIRLTNSLEQIEVTASLLNVPMNLSGYENLEFSLYANSIGAVYLNKKDFDCANLLGSDAGTTNQVTVSSQAVGLQVGGAFLAAAVLCGGIYAGVAIAGKATQSEINKIDAHINSPEIQEKIAKADKENAMFTKLTDYKTKVLNIKKAHDSNPEICTEVRDDIDKCIEGGAVKEFGYEAGIVTVKVTSTDLTFPALFTQKLYELEKYDNITYVGYESQEEEDAAGGQAQQQIVDPVTGEVIGTVAVKTNGSYDAEISFQMRNPLDAKDEKTEGGDK